MNRGIRNNNPLNIRLGKTKWKGQVDIQTDTAFCQFIAPEWGFRAAFCLFRTYATKYRLTCVKDIVTRWAPASENNTQRYIQRVCEWTGYGGNQRLSEADWPKLAKAMARQETSHIYDDDVIQRGFELYRQIINH